MPTEAYQSELDAINANTANQQAAFSAWMDKVIAAIRAKGYSVKWRLDTGGDGVFTTNATAQVDVTKEGITARVAYTNYHTSQTPTTAARLADTAWLSVKHAEALGLAAPTINPQEYDPILNQTSFNYNPEVQFATTKMGAPAVSLPPTNQPGVTNTTVPTTTNVPSGTSGSSPSNPDFGDAPTSPPPMSVNVIESGVDPNQEGKVSNGMLASIIALGVIAYLLFKR